MKYNLEGYCMDNTKEIRSILHSLEYDVESGHYTNIDYYIKYPFIVIYNGRIQYCHDRHLNRQDLYGENKKLILKNNILLLEVARINNEN